MVGPMGDRTLGVVAVALAELGRIEATLTAALEQVDTARVSLIAFRDGVSGEGGGER